jgi:hypothetical protein
MSNVYNLFPNNPERQPSEPTEVGGDFLATNPQLRTILAVNAESAYKLDAAAANTNQTAYIVFVRSLSDLMLDESFEISDEDRAIELTAPPRGFQLKSDFFAGVEDFSIHHSVAPNILAHLAVTHYVDEIHPQNPTRLFRPHRHLRAL